MVELVRLQICVEIDDTWAWVALGPERQPDATASTPEAAEDAPINDEGGQAVPAPIKETSRGDEGAAQGCWDFMWTCGEIDDRSGEILNMDDFMYGTADEGEWTDIRGIRWDFLRELTCGIPKTYQEEDR
ncbi:hypothetical protein Tco_1038847 [Tanacetum coccineum]